MHALTGLAIGMVIGFIEGLVLYAIPEDPYHRRVILPATLKGAAVGVLVGLTARFGSPLWGIMLGALYGLLLNRLTLWREGGATPKEASYVLYISIASGILIGVLTVLI